MNISNLLSISYLFEVALERIELALATRQQQRNQTSESGEEYDTLTSTSALRIES